MAGTAEVVANLSVPKASDLMAASRAQILPDCLPNSSQRASHSSLSPVQMTHLTLLSPVTGSQFMVATDTLINAHS